MSSELKINSLRQGIIRTLAYYDIFSYPLTASEVYYNLRENHTTSEEVRKELERLCNDKIIFNNGEFYLLTNDEKYIIRRKEGNKIADKSLKTAHRVSSFISRFPFIRGILLSGSISKGFMEKDSDIDYFIITRPNRVWFSRLMLMLFKKIFLLNSKKIFCINYFVDAENLEIQEKNIFTATELVTLLPTYGKDIYNELYEKNIWIKQYFPNFPKRETKEIIDRKSGMVKSFFEKVLGKKLGDKIDDFAMALFDKFYRLKYKNYNRDDFKLAFKSSKKESKHHPKFFQKKVLQEFDHKLKIIEERLKISL
ncbi:MAG: nucleotidyltransferase domain-containing protein [Ignavibacteriaceae bacterium]|nr:nucleotidyltransferase domain-containing protein [Ignavibacteriaceae bacterium]MCW8995308.1 nucleotidyltransferase domain-containing protein [Psychromonas sp.]